MENDFWNRLFMYHSTMTHIHGLLERGIISAADYIDFDTIIANKYGLSLYSIFRRNA